MKYSITFILFFAAMTSSIAQTRLSTDTIHLPKHIIKFSPISLLDFNTPSFQFSYEQKLKNSAAIQFELGYINNAMYRVLALPPTQGYRARVELRRYDYWHTRSSKKSYIGGMIMLKQSFKEKNNFFSRFDGLYQERFQYQEISTGVAAYFTMGKQFFFNNNTSLEIGFAAGLRYVYVGRAFADIPLDAQLRGNNFLDVEPGSYIFPSIFPIFKFGYSIP
jgi:hypothetical protein